MDGKFEVQEVTWSAAVSALRTLRTTVFIQEQQVPEDLEWDGLDDDAVHALARSASGEAIGCVRLLLHGTQAHIGRMAVLPAWRGKGVGRALLAAMLKAARDAGASSVFLNASSARWVFMPEPVFRPRARNFWMRGFRIYACSAGSNRRLRDGRFQG